MELKSVHKHIILPRVVDLALRASAKEQGCSQSWIITEALLVYLGMAEEEIIQARGYAIPKKLTERRGDWSLKKGGGKCAKGSSKD